MAPYNGTKANQLFVFATMLSAVLSQTKGHDNCSNGTAQTFERTTGVTIPSSHFLFSELQMVQTRTNDTWHYECYFLCAATSNCGGYFIDHDRQSCRLLPATSSTVRPPPFQRFKGSFYEKICMKTPSSCKRQWVFDRVIGMELDENDDKVMSNSSKLDCQQACLDETQFTCRSAEYNYDTELCVLSRNDRRTSPDSFQVSTQNVDYFENQCITVPKKCIFSRKARMAFPYYQTKVVLPEYMEPEACEKRCTDNADFVCRSFVYDQSKNECHLSSDDRRSVAMSEYDATKPNYDYYERSDCLEVTMKCDANTMTAIVTVGYPFRGRVYAMVNPEQCYYESNPNNSSKVALSMPLKSPLCGTKNMVNKCSKREFEFRNGNGTYVNSIIIQHHPNILRSTDRRIDVTCEYEEHKIRLKAGKNIEEPDDIANITSVVTGVAPTPNIRLRIVDASGNDVTGVDLGSNVFLRVELLDGDVYGISGTDLIARSGDDTENITLIDNQGCPIETSVFPALQTMSDSKSLEAPFQAFRFTSDGIVRFQITVSFCLSKCHPAYCDTEELGNVTSYGRKRRSLDRTDSSTLQNGDIVSDVVMEGALFVRSRLERQEIRQHQRSFDSRTTELGGRLKVCTSPIVVIGVSVVAAVLQMAIICSCVFVTCAGRLKSVFLRTGSDGDSISSPCLSELASSLSTAAVYPNAYRRTTTMTTTHSSYSGYIH